MIDRRHLNVRTAAIGASVLVALGAGAAFATDPFPTPDREPDPRIAALERREAALAAELRRANAVSARRWAAYRGQLAARRAEIARVNAANERTSAANADAAAAAAAAPRSAPAAAPAPVAYVPAAPVASSGSS